MTLKCLPLRVEHQPHEPAYSLLNRITLRHGTADVSEFVETIPGAPVAFAARVRRGDALAELATLSGAREENLYASTARVSGRNGRVRLGGIAVAERSELRFGGICPACLREDLDEVRGAEAVRPYRRTRWDLRIVKAYPTHSRLLLTACPGCGAVRDRKQGSPRWRHCGCDLSLAATAEVPQPDLEADRFIVGRITSSDAVPHPVLGGLALYDAMTLLLRVGHCALGGSQDAEIDLRKAAATPEQRCRIASAGWRALENWPRNFFPVLDTLVAGTSPGNRHRIAGRYGPRHLWLTKTGKPGYGPLRAAIMDHARSAHPATARNRLFGGCGLASHDASHKMTARGCGPSRPAAADPAQVAAAPRTPDHGGDRPQLGGRALRHRTDAGLGTEPPDHRAGAAAARHRQDAVRPAGVERTFPCGAQGPHGAADLLCPLRRQSARGPSAARLPPMWMGFRRARGRWRRCARRELLSWRPWRC